MKSKVTTTVPLLHYQSQRLLNDSLIRVDHTPVLFKEWLTEAILTINNLIKDSTALLSFEEFQNKYNIQACSVAFIGMISSLKTLRKIFRENISCPDETMKKV